MIRVYIASPYSTGNQADNVRRSMVAFQHLAEYGFAPFAPLLSHFQHLYFPRPYESWLDMDMEWLRQCDVLVRLPGDSSGADKEIADALRCNIPVYCIHEDFLDRVTVCDHIKLLAMGGEHDRQKI